MPKSNITPEVGMVATSCHWSDRKAKLAQERKEQFRANLMEDKPELAKALQVDHHIIRDIKSRFETWGTITERQIELVFKIASSRWMV